MYRRYALLTALAFGLLALPAYSDPRPAFGKLSNGHRQAEVATSRAFGEFRELSIIFELNETDQDAEVVIFAKAFEGMDRFVVTDPTGRKIIALLAKDREDIGQGQVVLESAEPSIEEVKDAFPEGMYKFEARTVSGERLFGTAMLTHELLPAPTFTLADEAVNAGDVVVEWLPVSGAAAFVIEIENDDLGVNLTATVTPDVTSFVIPAGFLLPGEEYEIGMTTVTPAGNVAVAESEFTTED